MAPTAANTLRDSIESQEQLAFRHYEHVRDLVLRMMDEARGYQTSAYWQQEIEGDSLANSQLPIPNAQTGVRERLGVGCWQLGFDKLGL